MQGIGRRGIHFNNHIIHLKSNLYLYEKLKITDLIFAIFSSPTWQKFYLENQCFDYDPVIKTAYVNYDMPVDWRSVTVLLKKEAFIMEARSELTGCQEGFSMIQKIDRETSAILAFGGTKDFSTVMNAYATYQSEVTRLAELLSSIYFPLKKKKKEK